MNRRAFLGAAAGALARPLMAAPARPNVVLIMADDLGYECLGANGGTSYRTPHLDRMAAGGIRFTHAYAQPLCAPTRAQLMTGLYNQRNWRAFGVMDPKETTFGHRMSKLGYKTVISGKWQLYSYNPPDFEPEWRGKGMLPSQSGFDEHCLWHALHTEDKGSRYGDPTMMVNGKLMKDLKDKYGPDLYSQFICDFMDRNRDKPFFAYYPMALTHGPFNPTPRSRDWVAKRLKSDRVYFADMVQYMDEVVGRVMSKVESLGLAERTLVMFYSDNGTDRSITSKMGEKVVKGGKGLTIDAGTHVPMIASWKGTAPAGRVCGDLIDSTDFLPTMLEAAGAPADKKLDGRSFHPQLQGKRGNPREWIYSWYDPRPGWAKAEYSLVRHARNQRWKLYHDGRFYDVRQDELEQRPIAPGAAGDEGEQARRKLKAVIDSYGT
ncbi:MAG: sulfatase-like hydrolase/transferase [Bryobacteraceae bacterium]|nr:sulfatase-like hydrolase/transferase [Bryobacteraceae bacterium]